MATTEQTLPSHGKHPIQVFTPTTITAVGAGGSLDTTSTTAIRIPEANDYQINGAGTVGTMPAGTTGISKSTATIKFVTAVDVEVM